MAKPYNDISRAAYTLDADAEPLFGHYHALPYPEHWNSDILTLCNLGREPDAEPWRTAPTARLDGVLQTLAPEYTVRARKGNITQEDHWLYYPQDIADPLPPSAFERLSYAWLRDIRPEPGFQHAVRETHAQLCANPPQWINTDVELFSGAATAGNTAGTTARQRQLAPDAIARRIMTLDDYDFGAGTLRFRAIPRTPRQQGAELVSQPLSYDIKGQPWWFSVFLSISLQTVPFEPRPRIHIYAGVRRWATKLNKDGWVYLPTRTATSVYITPKIPWLPGTPLSPRFAIATLAFNRATGAHEWGRNGPARILSSLQIGDKLPPIAEIRRDPATWIDEAHNTRVAIVHSTRMGSHAVGVGLMSHQRSQLLEWAEQALPEGMRRVSTLTRSKLGQSPPANARKTPVEATAKKAEEIRLADSRRSALAIATRLNLSGDVDLNGNGIDLASLQTADAVPVLRLRLLWQTSEWRDAGILALCELLGLKGDGSWPHRAAGPDEFQQATGMNPVVLTWSTDELTVILRCIPMTEPDTDGCGLAEALGVDRTSKPRSKAVAHAIGRRRLAAQRFMTADPGHIGEPELALVEIDRRKDFAFRWDDPKYALRLGCADAGVLTQFALVPKKAKNYNSVKNLDHRVRSAWMDGFRQLGVRVLPEHTLGDGLPARMRYAAIWMVKRRKDGPTGVARRTPVAVMVSPLGANSGLAAVAGWDSMRLQWIAYPRFLLQLATDADMPETESDDALIGAEESLTANNAAAHAVPAPRQGNETASRTRNTWKQSAAEQRQATARYLQKVLRSLRHEPTLIIVHAQNIRLDWPWIQDAETEQDLIKTGHAPAGGIDVNLRLLRVRDGDSRETPQWWGNAAPGGVNGLPPGLWVEPEEMRSESCRVFYSTTAKASTFRDSAVEADKLSLRPKRQGENKGQPTIDTHIPAWNPTLIELVLLACHEADKPEAFALAAHQLRQAPDYLDALSNPLPLHLASLCQEYVLPTLSEDDEAEDEDQTFVPLADSPLEGLGIMIGQSNMDEMADDLRDDGGGSVGGFPPVLQRTQ